MAEVLITGVDVQKMVGHWLRTPVNGYLGSDYGQDGMSLKQIPLGDPTAADAYLEKLKTDVQILDAFPAGTVNLYRTTQAPDKEQILIEVAGTAIAVPEDLRKER